MSQCDIVVPIALQHTNEGLCTSPWWVQDAEYAPALASYEPLINGEVAFKAVYEAIDAARKSIDITCWGFQPSMYFIRDGAHLSIGALLVEKAKQGIQVRVLAWGMPLNATGMAGEANLPGKSPNLKHRAGQTATDQQHNYDEWWFDAFGTDDGKAAQRVHENVPVLVTRGFSKKERGRIGDDVRDNGPDREISTKSRVAMMAAPSHHQKSVLVDYELPDQAVGFVMGHNMLDEYWDTDAHSALMRPDRKHPNPRPGTHDPDRGPRGALPRQDISSRVSGPILEYLHRNFADAWQKETSEDLLTARRAKEVGKQLQCGQGGTQVLAQLLRTQPQAGVHDIEKAYLQAMNNANRSIGWWVLVCLGLLAGAALCLLVWLRPEWLGVRTDSAKLIRWLLVAFGLTLLGMSSVGGFRLLAGAVGASSFLHLRGDDHPYEETVGGADSFRDVSGFTALKPYMREHYGRRWRAKVRLLLVVGDASRVDSLVQGLIHQAWLEGQGTVLLSGGDLREPWSQELFVCLRELRWGHSCDGIVWALDEGAIEDAAWLAKYTRQLRALAREFHWSAPLYLWQVCPSTWAQVGRVSQTVGCLFPPQVPRALIESSLRQLVAPLREQGMGQLGVQANHDFLLRLSRDLGARGISRWSEALAPVLDHSSRVVVLRGLFFSPAGTSSVTVSERSWWPESVWDGVLNDRQSQGQPVGWSWRRGLRTAALCLAGLCALALLLSFVGNRSQIATVGSALATLDTTGDADAQLKALHELTREMSRLDYRRTHGEPWHQRFGLSQNDVLLAALWPRYTQANNDVMRDVAAKHLEQALMDYAALPADSPERAASARQAHDQLKAYLMMARPEKVDPSFLAQVLTREISARPGVTPALWQGLSPDLWTFYARHLAAYPQWRIEPRPSLVAQARQVLLGQLGQRNGVANLYQQVLDRANNHFAAMTLRDMVGETDASMLFDSPTRVPGVFTRQAWEGQVRQAIDDVVEARREEIDWVLSDHRSAISTRE